MTEDNATLNTSGESSAQVQGQSEELVSTVEFPRPNVAATDPEGAKNTEAADTKEIKAETKEDAKPDLDRFDKHPRFVELNARLKAAEEASRKTLEELSQLKSQKAEAPAKKDETPPYKDWGGMSEDEILEWQSNDPKGFVDNIGAFVKHSIAQGIDSFREQTAQASEQQSHEAKVVSTYEAYAKDNADFDAMWDSGEIKSFMDKNPGHNAISAHMAMTAETRQQAAIDKAVADALKKASSDQRSKRATANILSSGPVAAPPAVSDAELKDFKSLGLSSTQVLANRLHRLRAASR